MQVRPHQGLSGKITPRAARGATEVAEPPRPRLTLTPWVNLDPAGEAPSTPLDIERLGPMQVQSNGYVRVRGVTYQIDCELGGRTIHIAERNKRFYFYDGTGTLLLEHPYFHFLARLRYGLGAVGSRMK